MDEKERVKCAINIMKVGDCNYASTFFNIIGNDNKLLAKVIKKKRDGTMKGFKEFLIDGIEVFYPMVREEVNLNDACIDELWDCLAIALHHTERKTPDFDSYIFCKEILSCDMLSMDDNEWLKKMYLYSVDFG